MGMDPLTLGLAMGGASALSTLVSGVTEMGSKAAQGKAQQAQAAAARQQARMQAEQGQVELAGMDRQKGELRRQFAEMQGRNRVALGAGNVDMSSGSALKVSDGNAANFGSDIAETAYSRALKDYETRNAVKATEYQADVLDAQGSYAQRSMSKLLPTILGAGLSGAGSFMTGYSYGGKLTK